MTITFQLFVNTMRTKLPPPAPVVANATNSKTMSKKALITINPITVTVYIWHYDFS